MRSKAFTLIELMVSLGIFIMIIALIGTITGRSRISWTESSARIFLHSQARRVSLEFSRELMLSNPSQVFLEDLDNDGKFERVSLSISVSDDNRGLSGGVTEAGLRFGHGLASGNKIVYLHKGDDLLRQLLDVEGNTVEERAIAQNVSMFSVVKVDPQYEITLAFRLEEYLGKPLSEPMSFTTVIAVTPKN
ncbi:PilW family protein [Candidatus Omnitrophota bacterium]